MKEAFAYIIERLPPDERDQITAAVGDWTVDSLWESVKDTPRIRVLFADQRPFAMGGVLPGDGPWQSWCAITDEARTPENLTRLTAACVESFDEAMEAGAPRVDVYCLASRPKIHRWYESMGLKRAQELEAYGARGEAFVRYEVSHVLG
jgi:hypothetical protein